MIKYLYWLLWARTRYSHFDFIRHVGYICEFGMVTPDIVKRDMHALARRRLMNAGDVTRHVWSLMLDQTECNYFQAYRMVSDGHLSDLPKGQVWP